MGRVTVAILLLSMATALAAPPSGTDSAEHRWWECHRQNKPPNQSCCSISDGHALGDNDWRGGSKGYEVKIEGIWWSVPQENVIGVGLCGPEPDTDDQTSAKVWYAPEWDLDGKLKNVIFYCFMPGTMVLRTESPWEELSLPSGSLRLG